VTVLAYGRYYGHDAMRRALTGAGQLAHVPEVNIWLGLEWLWDDERLEERDDPVESAAVPIELVRAQAGGAIPKRTAVYLGGTVDYMVLRCGGLCSLCLSVNWPKEMLFADDLGLKFYRHICPTWTLATGREPGDARAFSRPPVCEACHEAIEASGALAAVGDGPAGWNAAIAVLMGDRSFRRRLDAGRDLDLRFDPRRPLRDTARPRTRRQSR
jgi:hypothetical protein